jgi:hypothetical protein
MLAIEHSNHIVAANNNGLFYMLDNSIEFNEQSYIKYLSYDVNKVEIYTKKPWVSIYHKNALDKRTAGWKIHISSILENHLEIFKIISTYCITNEINFKFLADINEYRKNNSKDSARVSHGKFIVLYPPEGSILKVLEDLYVQTKQFEGPYILTDKRYKDSKVLYYRYGEIHPIRKVSERCTYETFIENNQKKLERDRRVPYYRVPEWVEDLSVSLILEENESMFLSKYKPIEALHFSSSGGIYVVEDHEKKQWIAIEAREHTALDIVGFYAFERLERQREFLLNLNNTGITPKVHDFIIDSGNGYLIEERIIGKTLREYVFLNNPLLSLEKDEINIKKYYNSILDILNQLIEKVRIIHEHEIAIGDISDNNIILEQKSDGSFNVRIIDLEYSTFLSENIDFKVGTPGYRNNHVDLVKRDNEIVMLLGLNMIYPLFGIYELKESQKIIFLEWAKENIPFLSKTYINILLNYYKSQNLNTDQHKLFIKYTETELLGYIDAIYETFDLSKRKKGYYIPADPHIFNTNPFSVCHGIYGVLLGTYQTYSNLKRDMPTFIEEISSGIFEKEFSDIKNLPTSLLIGSSGIVATLLKLGQIDKAKILFKEVDTKSVPVLNDLFYGKAGLVLMYLYYWLKTEDSDVLEKAKDLSDQLIGIDDLEYSGLYEGKAGISLALLLTYITTKDERYFKESERILNEIIELLYVNKFGNLTMNRTKMGSKHPVESSLLYNGLSGVGMLLIAFYKVTGNLEYKNYLEQMVKGLEHKIKYFPGLMRGLAGVTDFLISYYHLDDENKKLYESIDTKISTFRLFEITNESNFLGFPGEQALKISHDLYTGSMGILTVISRWISYVNNQKKSPSTDIVLSITEELIECFSKDRIVVV